MEDKIQ